MRKDDDVKLYNSTDAARGEASRELLASGRGSILEAAEARPTADRFSAIPCPDSPAMIVCDEVTGRSTKVPLYAYGALRAALGDLFAGDVA